MLMLSTSATLPAAVRRRVVTHASHTLCRRQFNTGAMILAVTTSVRAYAADAASLMLPCRAAELRYVGAIIDDMRC